jgi:hypothetical protein
LVGGFAAVQLFGYLPGLKHQEVFGYDGNGGRMLKIITNLTDEEMARLKFVRRLNWHWKGSRKFDHGKDMITTQELSDRGINWPQEPYIEYEKRPPHDKYL